MPPTKQKQTRKPPSKAKITKKSSVKGKRPTPTVTSQSTPSPVQMQWAPMGKNGYQWVQTKAQALSAKLSRQDLPPPTLDEVYLGSMIWYHHGLWTPREEIAFTARPKIQSQSQIFRYG